jgi:hypothetical protein
MALLLVLWAYWKEELTHRICMQEAYSMGIGYCLLIRIRHLLGK